MRLLILSNYFTPDLSAGSFRMQALVDALEQFRDRGLHVTVMTTRPNRYASLRTEAPEFEDHGWLNIHRIPMPAHRNGMADQARSYSQYALSVRRLTRGRHWDAVFATSSRLMTAGLGAHVARRLGAPLYLDIRDLFTDNMDELLAGSPVKALLPAFRMIERRAFNRARRINVVSRGFEPHVRSIAAHVPVSVHTNGIDAIFSETDFRKVPAQGDSSRLPLILYAGNMGEGQGLHRIIPEAAARLEGKARFRLIGDGGRRDALKAALRERNLDNVELLPPVPRGKLLDHYRAADILFLHLNDLDAFRKVLPSKLFEYAATGKPIIAGVAGHAAEFCRDNIAGTEVFDPLDADALEAAVLRRLGDPAVPDRAQFAAHFSREAIMRKLAAEIMELMGLDPSVEAVPDQALARG